MKPTVIASANAAASAGAHPGGATSNGINIPINHEYGGTGQPLPPQQHQGAYHQHPQQQQPPYAADANHPAAATYGSPRQHPQQQQQIPAHFQDFGFQPDMDMGMFPRTRIGRMHHDPFAGFGSTRKRNSAHEPHSMTTDGFSRYFDDDADFDFPQFGSMGRRRAGAGADHTGVADEHDFFNRLPSEFRQYIPETFGHRRGAGNGAVPQPQHHVHPQPAQQAPAGQYYQSYVPAGTTPPTSGGINIQQQQQQQPQSPSKKLCDAAIQTEDPSGGHVDMVDHATSAMHTDHLNQHGLRNTVDMGIKSTMDAEGLGQRSHSAPPPEQLQQQQQYQQQQQQIPVSGKRQTPPPNQASGHPQFGTQTSPQVQAGVGQHAPQFHKAYYPPQQQPHPTQHKQQTPPPPQTPGGTYIRTIPIFVEGRSEPIINAHKEIPNQNAPAASASARAFTPPTQQQQYYQQPPHPHQQQQQHPQQQQHRPTPLNTQHHPQQQQTAGPQSPTGVPPQTPHTLDSINKIQDIQRDVLDLMSKVEQFGGTRKEKEYAYLDEMLTRNLLKLDTIDTNGKDSIRLARKEAIKCIQASINVLEAKAEENVRKIATLAAAAGGGQLETAASATATNDNEASAQQQQKSSSKGEVDKDETNALASQADNECGEPQPVDATKIQEPIPLPPPEGMQASESAAEVAESANTKETSPNAAESSAQTTVESK